MLASLGPGSPGTQVEQVADPIDSIYGFYMESIMMLYGLHRIVYRLQMQSTWILEGLYKDSIWLGRGGYLSNDALDSIRNQ